MDVKILEYNKKSGKLAKNIKFNIEDYTENEYDDDGHFIGKKIKRLHAWAGNQGRPSN